MKLRQATNDENELHDIEVTEVAADLQRIRAKEGEQAVIRSINARIYGSATIMAMMGYPREEVLQIVERIATQAVSLVERARYGGGNG